ncbi:MAG: hypothetical protein AAF717_09230 [Bacteroidota bacterium]
MTRGLVSTILLLIVFFRGTAQETNLEILESPKFREQVRSNEIVGMHATSGGEKGIVRFAKEHLTLEVFGEALKPIFTITKPKGKKETHLGTVYHNDQITFLTINWPKRKVRELYAYVFDITTRKLTKKLLLTSKVENPKNGMFSRTNSYQNRFDHSTSGNYISFVLDDFKSQTNSFTVYVLEIETLAFVFEKTLHEGAEKFFDLNDILVDDLAHVYLIKKSFFKGRRERKDNTPSVTYRFYRVTEEETKNTVFEAKDKFINTLSFGLESEQLMVLGFFTEKKVPKIKGVCSLSFDKASLEVISKKFDDLPLSVYQDLYGDDEGKAREGKGLGGSLFEGSNGIFYVDHVLKADNGSMYLIAEEFYITTNTTSTGGFNGTMMTTTTYNYDDILVIKFKKSGEMAWGRNIFKRSTTPSYNAFLKGNELHLILNSGKNLLEKQDGRTKVSKGWFESTSLYDITFSEGGDVNYNKIQDNKGKSYYLPASGTFSNGEFLMISRGDSPDDPYKTLMLLK